MGKTRTSNTFQTYKPTVYQYDKDEMLRNYNETVLMFMCLFVAYVFILWFVGCFDSKKKNKKHKKLSDIDYAEQYKEVDLRQRMEYITNNSISTIYIQPFQSYIIHLSYKNKQNKDETKSNTDDKKDNHENKNILQMTAVDLMNEFGASTIYCHGNEIILVFQQQYSKKMLYDETMNRKTKGNHLFNGKTSDILTRVTSFASFSASSLKIKNSKPYFDAKIIVFPRQYEVSNYLLMHSKYAFINHVNKYAIEKYTSEKIFSKSTDTLVKMLLADGIDVMNEQDRYGYFVKKNKERHTENQHTEHKTKKGYSDHYYRLSTIILSFPVKYNKNFVKFVESKYYDSSIQLKDIVELKC